VAQPQTSDSTPRLSELARHVVIPSGAVTTSWPSVSKKCAELGIFFDPWQDGAGKAILAKRVDGTYAASVGGVVISIPRQVGKTFLLGAIAFALCLLHPKLTVIWTAQRLRTAGETFAYMQGLTRRQRIRPHVDRVVLGSGEEEIRFRNGSRILFGARERGFGRGFAQVDVIVFDEAQILSENAIDDMIPATNQARHPSGALVLMTGTPPKPTDPSDIFSMKRREALSGDSDDTLYIEFSADPDAHADDHAQWRRANPSFPKRTSVAALQRMRKNLAPESFLREGLGIWDDDASSSAIPYGPWLKLADPDAERGTDPLFAVDVATDRLAWVAVLWRRPDDGVQVMLANGGDAMPAHRVVEECARLVADWGGEVVAPPSLEEDFDRAGIDIVRTAASEFAVGCGLVADAVKAGTLRHGNQTALNAAVRVAVWRSAGSQGEQAFQLRGMPEVGPLAAVARGLWRFAQQANYEPMDSVL
jgi:hypothetical protein